MKKYLSLPIKVFLSKSLWMTVAALALGLSAYELYKYKYLVPSANVNVSMVSAASVTAQKPSVLTEDEAENPLDTTGLEDFDATDEISIEWQTPDVPQEESVADRGQEAEPSEEKAESVDRLVEEVIVAKDDDASKAEVENASKEEVNAKEEVEDASKAEVSVQSKSPQTQALEPLAGESEKLEESTPTSTSTSTKESTAQAVADEDKPMLAIVIDDMGINQPRTKDILSLHAPLTSSFLTYGKNLNELAMAANEAGHELMIHTPMEPKVPASLAPDTMKVSMDQAEIEKLFKGMLLKFKDLPVRGINNHMGSLFTENAEKLGIVMDILKEKNLYFLDSKTTPLSKAADLAAKDRISYVSRDVFLDNVNERAAIQKQLESAEKLALKKGYAIAIGHPKSQTYLALKDWLQGSHQVRLVPLSQIVAKVNPKD